MLRSSRISLIPNLTRKAIREESKEDKINSILLIDGENGCQYVHVLRKIIYQMVINTTIIDDNERKTTKGVSSQD